MYRARAVGDPLRMLAGIWTVDGQGQSGQVGTAHYENQLPEWLENQMVFVPMGKVGTLPVVRYAVCAQWVWLTGRGVFLYTATPVR